MIKKGRYIAVRPNALIEARYDLTASQNDILDVVLSKIDDDNYLYEIDINDYKNLYRTDTSNIYRDLKKAVKEFEGKGFYLIDTISNKEIFFHWFSSISYLDSEGKIVVEIGNRLKNLLVEMKKRIYYKIEYPLNFSSIYSKRMYYYLKSFEDTNWRIDNIDKLRIKLQCPESYSKYSFFKNKVLEVAKKEINEYSDITFNYKPIFTGKKVTSIDFSIIPKDKKLDDSFNKELVSIVKTIFDEELTDPEIQELLYLSNNNIEKIKEKYEISKKQNIDNIVAWMKKAIINNYKAPLKKIDTFNDFEQRQYDYADLEKRLLGNM